MAYTIGPILYTLYKVGGSGKWGEGTTYSVGPILHTHYTLYKVVVWGCGGSALPTL